MIISIIQYILYTVLAVALILLITYLAVRHRLKFDPENKDFNKIAVYGDVRSSYKVHNQIINMIRKEKPDMILFTGDIASNSHNFLHFLIYSIIENKVWKDCEYYPTRGNHESDLNHYKAFLDLPNGSTYYSFDRMGMHFVVLDCWNVFAPIDDEELEWFKNDLEKNKDKPITVSLHLPFFTSGKYEPYHEPRLMELFDRYNVLFVFSAHVHSYERSLYKGTNFVVTAGGGAPLYPETRENPEKVIRVNNHHYCILTKNNDEYTLKVIDINGNQIDEVTTSKKMVESSK